MRVQLPAGGHGTVRVVAAWVLTGALVIAIAVLIGTRGESANPSSLDYRSSVPMRSSATQPATGAAAPGAATSGSASGSASRSARAVPMSAARRTLAALVKALGADRVSVAGYDVATGASVSGGAQRDMRPASLAKLQLLETLLLQHQQARTALTDVEIDTLSRMIENSDNAAADATFANIGGRDRLLDLEPALGLSPAKTVPGSGYYWGLTRTSAMQQLLLLKNLVSSSSPLSPHNRAFALGLLRNVENDQRWGVPVVADPGTTVAVKNGWLAVQDDDYDESRGSWAVNSGGIVTVRGHQLLIVVMSQHDADFASGIDLVERLIRAAATAVRN